MLYMEEKVILHTRFVSSKIVNFKAIILPYFVKWCFKYGYPKIIEKHVCDTYVLPPTSKYLADVPKRKTVGKDLKPFREGCFKCLNDREWVLTNAALKLSYVKTRAVYQLVVIIEILILRPLHKVTV